MARIFDDLNRSQQIAVGRQAQSDWEIQKKEDERFSRERAPEDVKRYIEARQNSIAGDPALLHKAMQEQARVDAAKAETSLTR